MKPPIKKKCNGHWIITDCQGNDVGFDTHYREAEFFYISEISEYIAWEYIGKLKILLYGDK